MVWQLEVTRKSGSCVIVLHDLFVDPPSSELVGPYQQCLPQGTMYPGSTGGVCLDRWSTSTRKAPSALSAFVKLRSPKVCRPAMPWTTLSMPGVVTEWRGDWFSAERSKFANTPRSQDPKGGQTWKIIKTCVTTICFYKVLHLWAFGAALGRSRWFDGVMAAHGHTVRWFT